MLITKLKPKSSKRLSTALLITLFLIFGVVGSLAVVQNNGLAGASHAVAGNVCGGNDDKVTTSIDFGCRGLGNPIMDMIFAVIRFLSIGVGLVIVASIIVAGIQFTSARDDPQATSKALARVRSAFTALLIFIFTYAILNFVIPGQLLR